VNVQADPDENVQADADENAQDVDRRASRGFDIEAQVYRPPTVARGHKKGCFQF
jgi:hypothetical protein